MSPTPTLKTERLILRLPKIEDWPAFLKTMGAERSCYMGGPFEVDAAWGMFCHGVAQWALMGHGALTIENRQSGECLGQIEINSGPLFPEHELGWVLHQEAEGCGYAYEAAKALKHWAFAERNLDTLVSYIDPPNLRSCALAERLGAKLDMVAAKQDPDDLVYRHPQIL